MEDKRPKVIVIGELNVDLIAGGLSAQPAFGNEIVAADFNVALGSASAIFACGIARLGFPVTLISKVGADYFGEFCLKALEECGVATKMVIKDPRVKTGVTMSLSSPTDRALVTYLGAISELRYEELPLSVLKGHSHLHMTSYFLQEGLRRHFPSIFEQARQMNLTTSFDPNGDPTGTWNKEIWEALAHTDILFLNESEALQLTGESDVHRSLERLGQVVACAVVKLAARGAAAIKEGRICFAPGFKVEAIDTTGAGDCFDAGFIFGFLNQEPIQRCLEIGNACGAQSTLKPGGTAGQSDEARVRSLLDQKAEEDDHRSLSEPCYR
jgi:sugar/nucleoside kinase (ribokinase family)